MAQTEITETYNIKDIKGDVWLHHDKASQLISGEGHAISLGDAIITAPMAEAMIEVSSNQHIHLGSHNKEVLVLDHSVQDQIHDVNEVTIEPSSLSMLSGNAFSFDLGDDISFNALFDQTGYSFFSQHEDSALTYHDTHQHEVGHITHIEVRDVISDFNPTTDRFSLPFRSAIALGSNEFTEAQNKVNVSNLAIAFHKIDDHGYVSFKDIQGHEIQLNDANMLHSVVDYLTHNFNGRIGDTLMFKVANDSYIFHYHPDVYAQQFGLTKFEGLAFDGMSQGYDSHLGNYLHVDFS